MNFSNLKLVTSLSFIFKMWLINGWSKILKVNSLIKQELSNIIENEISDPRVNTIVTIQKIKSSKDFSVIKIYVSLLCDDNEVKSVYKGLKSSEGYVRKLLQLAIKNIRFGKLSFQIDSTPKNVLGVSKLLDSINN